MTRPVHFEIPADDPARAVNFYSTVFGWKINKLEGERPYWLIETANGTGIGGGVGPREPNFPAPAVVMNVEDIDHAVSRAVSAGGEVVYEKHTIPGTGLAAYVKDTEGNLFGMIQYLADAH
jgi:predicted enzyme related to lactoylglutathione lyase